MTNQTTVSKKTAGRELALQLLTKQLEVGTKPISKGRKPLDGKDRIDKVPLTLQEIAQKKYQGTKTGV